MSDLTRKPQHFNFNEFTNTTIKSVNFVSGFILLTITLFFMFSREAFMRPEYQIDGLILMLGGVLSLTAAMSDKVRTVYVLNLVSGGLLLLGALGIISIYGHTGEDFLVHAFLGVVFLYNALSCRRLL